MHHHILHRALRYILLHMLMDTFPALYQRGVAPLWSVEIWGTVWMIVIMFIAVKQYRKM